ncbi:MAG: RidA family protein [Acidobacteriota bacterium]
MSFENVQTVQPAGWSRPRGYANGLLVPPGRSLLFVAGMIGWDETETLVSPDLVPQFEQALLNVRSGVETAGGRPEDLVRLTGYLVDVEGYRSSLKEIGAAWRRVLGKTFPTMAFVGVASLVEPSALVELEAVAALPADLPDPGSPS